MPSHAAGQAGAQPLSNFPTQIRRNSAFSESMGTVPHSRSARSQSMSVAGAHHGGGLAREGILPAKSRSPYRDKSASMDGSFSRPRRHSANVPEFNEKHLHRLQSKMARRSSGNTPPMTTNAQTLGGLAANHPLNTRIHQSNSRASNDLGNCWWRVSSVASGEFQRCGLHTIISASKQKTQYCCVYKPVKGGREVQLGDHCVVSTQIKVVKLPNVEKHDVCENIVNIIFGCKSMINYCSLSIDVTSGGYWSLSQVTDGTRKVVAKVADEEGSLRHNMFYSVRIEIKGDKVSVAYGGASGGAQMRVFNEVPMSLLVDGGRSGAGEEKEGDILLGDVGILCRGSRCVVKDWLVTDFNIDGLKKFESKMSDVPDRISPPPPNSARSGADSRLAQVPEFNGLSADDRKFATMILEDVVDSVDGISFTDIVELNVAKRLLQEAVVLPLVVPQLFVGIRSPWAGVLLYGPPGTGKTLLAKAVAGQQGSTFFNCSTASLVSKFRGESEKIVRTLFHLARVKGPSVVFLDEVDALVSTRGAAGEHEASRRLKTELYTQMDGIQKTFKRAVGADGEENVRNGQVMVLAATNCPWDLDDAMRRRLEKRIYIPLPDEYSRALMFAKHIDAMNTSGVMEEDVLRLAQLSQDYSGADIHLVCREANMAAMRRVIDGKTPIELVALREAGGLSNVVIHMSDMVEAIEHTKKSVTKSTAYDDWEAKFGSC